MFFFALNESLDSLWSRVYGSDDYYYHLEGIEVRNNCLIAYGSEIPISDSPWELDGRFFLLKYNIDDLEMGLESYNLLTSNLDVFPNPSAGFITFNSNALTIGENIDFSAYDVLGKVVFSTTQAFNPNSMLDLSEIATGQYVLKVSSHENSVNSILIMR